MNSQNIESKDPQDYYAAMETVLTLLGVGVAKINHPYAKAVGAALPVIGKIAPKVAPVAAPLAEKVKEHAPAAMNAARTRAAGAAGAAAGALGNVANRASGALGSAAATVGGAGNRAASAVGAVGSKAATAVGSLGGVGQKVKDSRAKREQEKARAQVRRAVLDTADLKMSLPEFLEKRANRPNGASAFLDYPGVYAIVRFEKGLKRSSYENYSEIYVHASGNIGDSIMDDIEGRGNVNVYADYKYGQDLHVLAFPCPEDTMEELAANIEVALDADCSYNALSRN